MAWSPPTLAGFELFVTNNMQIPSDNIPDAPPDWQGIAFAQAMQLVNIQLNAVSPDIYTLAVYNLAGDILINICPDVPNAPIVQGSAPPATFFVNLRQKWNINGFVSGVINSASDEGTSSGLVVPEQFSNFTVADLQNLKTPYGRQYLALAQNVGTIWGLT